MVRLYYATVVVGQGKCPGKCSAKMSLRYAAMVSDVDGLGHPLLPSWRTSGLQITPDGGPVDAQLPFDCPQRHALAPGFLDRLPSLPLSISPSEGRSACAGRRLRVVRRRLHHRCSPVDPPRVPDLRPAEPGALSSVHPSGLPRWAQPERRREAGGRCGGIPGLAGPPEQR